MVKAWIRMEHSPKLFRQKRPTRPFTLPICPPFRARALLPQYDALGAFAQNANTVRVPRGSRTRRSWPSLIAKTNTEPEGTPQQIINLGAPAACTPIVGPANLRRDVHRVVNRKEELSLRTPLIGCSQIKIGDWRNPVVIDIDASGVIWAEPARADVTCLHSEIVGPLTVRPRKSEA